MDIVRLMIGSVVFWLVVSSFLAFLGLPTRVVNTFRKRMAFMIMVTMAWTAFTSAMITYAFVNSGWNGFTGAMVVLGVVFVWLLASFTLYTACRAEEAGGIVYRRR